MSGIKLKYKFIFLITVCAYMCVSYWILLVASERNVKQQEYFDNNSLDLPKVLFSKEHLNKNVRENINLSRTIENSAKKFAKYTHSSLNDSHKLSHSGTSYWKAADKEKTVFTFSAYFDNVSQPLIRLLGISLNNRTQPELSCELSESSKGRRIGTIYSRNATIQSLPEDKGRGYLGIFVLCQLQLGDKPTDVAIKLKNSTTSGRLPFTRIVYPVANNDEFRVCFPAITSKYSNPHELVQTVEMSRIFGSKKFFIYNHGAVPGIERILNLYQTQKVFEVIDWKLPVTDIHYFAQMVAINDCLYRNVGTKYVLFMDLDEMLVPRQHHTWKEMMKVLDKPKYDIATFSFQSCFFQKSWKDVYEKLSPAKVDGFNTTALVKKYKIQLLSKIFREKNLQRIRYRSKFIVRPEKVKTVGIHVVYEYRGIKRFTYVNPKIAFLHHYRAWKHTEQRIEDRSLQRFTKPLVQGVHKIWKLLHST